MFESPGNAGGRPVEPLTGSEIEELLDLLRKGHGRDSACRELKIHYRRLKRALDQDPELRAECLHARRCADQGLTARAYDLATSGDNEDALFKLIARRDRSRALSLARADAAAERELRRKEQGKAVGWTLPYIVDLMVKAMSPGESAAYLGFVDKKLNGQPLGEVEAREWERLTALSWMELVKAAARDTPAVP